MGGFSIINNKKNCLAITSPTLFESTHDDLRAVTHKCLKFCIFWIDYLELSIFFFILLKHYIKKGMMLLIKFVF